MEDAQPFVTKDTLLISTPEIKDAKQVSKTTNLNEIERMASNLDLSLILLTNG
jgi:hypothetical protein